MEKPTVDQVLKSIYDLYENPDLSAKEQASGWLNEFQKSVSFQLFFSLSLNVIKVDTNIVLLFQIYAWETSDKLLLQKSDLNSCYFAAQTMRSKIQNSFHELPEVRLSVIGSEVGKKKNVNKHSFSPLSGRSSATSRLNHRAYRAHYT